jgi:glutamate racemase
MKNDNRPIGVFDSGLGGLTVVSALRKALPNEDIIYLGDTARVPYGNKSEENIRRFGNEICSFLESKGVKLIVVACNTVSAVAVSELRETFAPIPVIGVLEAGVDACVKSEPKSVTVIGTRATVNSDAYRREIHKQNPSIVIDNIACPLFVPLVEEGVLDNSITTQAIDYYLGALKDSDRDILILGCTHYPLLISALADYIPNSMKIIDSATACAEYTTSYLVENGLTASQSNKASDKFYVTDLATDFLKQASRFLGYTIEYVEKVTL